MRFQWDKAKGQKNLKIHGISFAEAVQIFNGPTLETLDTRAGYGEDRWIAIGSINDGTFVVVYIEQEPEDGMTWRCIASSQPARQQVMRDETTKNGARQRRTDKEIRAGIAADPDAAPELDSAWFAQAIPVTPPNKQQVSIRLDADVLEHFRSMGRGYQTRINAVLRQFVEHQKRVLEASLPPGARSKE